MAIKTFRRLTRLRHVDPPQAPVNKTQAAFSFYSGETALQ